MAQLSRITLANLFIQTYPVNFFIILKSLRSLQNGKSNHSAMAQRRLGTQYLTTTMAPP